MYSKIKCPYKKNLIKINSKKGKKILLDYIKYVNGGGPKLYLNDICSLENMFKANRLFFENQSKIKTEKKRYIHIETETVLQFYPGDNNKYWHRCSNPGDGHCFYWSLYRTLLALNKYDQLPEEIKRLNLLHLGNPNTDYKKQVSDIAKLRQAAYEIAIRKEAPFTNITDDELQMMKVGYIKANEGVGVGREGWASDWDMMASAIICGICIAVFQTTTSSRREWVVFYPQIVIENHSCSPYMCFCINLGGSHFDSLIPIIKEDDEGISYREDINMHSQILEYILNNSEVLNKLKDSAKKMQIANLILELIEDENRDGSEDNALTILNLLNDYINHDKYGFNLKARYDNPEDRLLELIFMISFYITMSKLNTPPPTGIKRDKPALYKKNAEFLIVAPLKWKSLDDMVRAIEIFKQKIIKDIKKLNIPRLVSLRDYTISEFGSILYPSASGPTVSGLTEEASTSSKPTVLTDEDEDLDLKAAIAASLIIDSEKSVPKSTSTPIPISSKKAIFPEIISRELCGINPNTNMCNAKFKDKDCVQILKNGRKVCVKADSI